MGCDLHMVLERCLRKPDAATQRTRVLCILLAKRAASEPLQDAAQEPPQDVAQKDKSPFELPSELWLRIAQECPVTFGEVDKWVRCRYAEWVVADAPLWSRLHAEFKAKYMAAAALAREEVSQSRSEQPDEDEGELDEDEDAGDKVECEVHQQALHAARTSYVHGYSAWDEELPFAELGSRNYDRFGLINAQVRRSSVPGMKQLGCMRLGWPADVHQPSLSIGASRRLGFDDFHQDDPDLHSHCYCSLAGLLAVDWDVACNSTVRGGQALRPRDRRLDMSLVLERRMELLRNSNWGHHLLQQPRFAAMTDEEQRASHYCWVPDDEEEINQLLAREHLDEEELAGDEVETRRDIMQDQVVRGLNELHARMLEGGAAPEDLRLIICFDN